MWNWDPYTLVGGCLLIGLYLFAVGSYRTRNHLAAPYSFSQTIWFILGIIIILLGQISPLDSLSDNYLLSAHMLQHMLFTVVAPPLLLLGTPGWLLAPILKKPFWKRIGLIFTNPFFAFLVFNINFLIWHFPAAYELTLNNELIHFIEHMTFISTALLFWWPILSPVSDLPRLSYPFQVLYIFAAAIPSTVLGALIVFSPTILYSTYENAPSIYGFDPATDQQVAGVIMAAAENMIYLLFLTIIFFRWLGHEEKKA